MNAIETAIGLFGSQEAMAQAIGVRQPTVSEWLRGARPVPQERRAEIEYALKGRVACEDFGDDMRWKRVPDKSWPHPLGRPLLDVLPEAA